MTTFDANGTGKHRQAQSMRAAPRRPACTHAHQVHGRLGLAVLLHFQHLDIHLQRHREDWKICVSAAEADAARPADSPPSPNEKKKIAGVKAGWTAIDEARTLNWCMCSRQSSAKDLCSASRDMLCVMAAVEAEDSPACTQRNNKQFKITPGASQSECMHGTPADFQTPRTNKPGGLQTKNPKTPVGAVAERSGRAHGPSGLAPTPLWPCCSPEPSGEARCQAPSVSTAARKKPSHIHSCIHPHTDWGHHTYEHTPEYTQ